MRRHLVIAISVAVLVMLAPVLPVYAEEIILSVGNWPPYIDRTAANHGWLSAIVVTAFQRVGITATLTYRPWKRVEVEIDQQQRLSFGWIWTQARSQKWHYSHAVYKGSTVFAVRKDRGIAWQTLQDLKPFVVGVTRGYSAKHLCGVCENEPKMPILSAAI